MSVTIAYTTMPGVKRHVSVLPHYPPSATHSCGRHTHASTAPRCTRCIQTATSWLIEYDLAVLLKHLSVKDLSEKIGRISLSRIRKFQDGATKPDLSSISALRFVASVRHVINRPSASVGDARPTLHLRRRSFHVTR